MPPLGTCTKQLFLLKKQLDKYSAGKILLGCFNTSAVFLDCPVLINFLKARAIMRCQKWNMRPAELSSGTLHLVLKFYAIYSELK